MDVATHPNQPWTRHDTFLNSGENSGRFKLYQPVVRQLIERMVLPGPFHRLRLLGSLAVALIDCSMFYRTPDFGSFTEVLSFRAVSKLTYKAKNTEKSKKAVGVNYTGLGRAVQLG